MLESLIVNNFAIIEDLTVNFTNGMTVLTGETGAGKSLIIDTISLLLGSRADSDMIRYGESKASIKGIFTHNSIVEALFLQYGIPISDKITIYREILDSSRNVIKINNHSVSLQMLKSIASLLADIHVQNDTYRLFNPDNYLDLVNPKDDNKYDSLYLAYSKALFKYNEAIQTYEKIQKGQKATLDRLEFLEYEANELRALDLYEGIDIELEDKINKLSNFDKISNCLISAYNSLNDNDPIDMLYDSAKELERIASYDDEYSDYASKLLDSYYISSEIKDEIAKAINSLDYDEEELNIAIERLNDINKAKEKYKKSVEELISYLNQITLEIDMVTNYDEVLGEAKNNVIKAYNDLVLADKALSQYRRKLAKMLEKGIINECLDLDLNDTRFEIVFNDISYDNPFNNKIFNEYGTDNISFMISFNKGEPLKPLYKVASGGEMSRIMLAFKSYFSKDSVVSLMIFDEIDTGVSGSTAKKIAEKMYQISKRIQVLCITHLPQVAAKGDNHKKIYKILNDGRTQTQIEDLSFDKRVEEIAVMLSGDRVSLYALEHAKELLQNK